MNYLKKAKSTMKDVQEINTGLKKLGFDASSYTKSKSSGSPAASASADSAPSPAPSTAPPPSSVAPSSPPIATPASSTFQAEGPLGPPVPPCIAPGAPVPTAKLSLAVRKNLRDNFDAQVNKLEADLSQILGVPWRIFADTAGLWTYTVHQSSARDNFGAVLYRYFESANDNIRRFVSTYGEDGRRQLNDLASKHILTLEPTTDSKISYHYAKIESGRLAMLFKDDKLCVNNTSVLDELAKVVNDVGSHGPASTGSLSMEARMVIKRDYDAKIPDVVRSAQTTLKAPIQFDPNFEHNAAALLAFEKTLDYEDYDDRDKLDPRWQESFGRATFSYFDSFATTLKDQKFHKDEMLQEGFNEMVYKHVVRLVVTNTISKSYNDIVIEDGTLLIRTTPTNWWTNSGQACAHLVDIL